MKPDPLDRFSRRAVLGPSVGDVLLDNTQSVRLQLSRFIDDEGRPTVSCMFKLTGEMDLADNSSAAALFRGVVRSLSAERPDDSEGDGQ